jgi:hypothetical protein
LLSFRFATRASTSRNIRVRPAVQLVAVKGDAALTDRDFGQLRADFAVEAVAIHPEVGGRVAVADEARQDHGLERVCKITEWWLLWHLAFIASAGKLMAANFSVVGTRREVLQTLLDRVKTTVSGSIPPQATIFLSQ